MRRCRLPGRSTAALACTRRGLVERHRAALKPRSTLPVYQRQLFPERVLGEAAPDAGVTLGKRRRAPSGIS